jgi:hypothetical protein
VHARPRTARRSVVTVKVFTRVCPPKMSCISSTPETAMSLNGRTMIARVSESLSGAVSPGVVVMNLTS